MVLDFVVPDYWGASYTRFVILDASGSRFWRTYLIFEELDIKVLDLEVLEIWGNSFDTYVYMY